jgi:hypothetical protein
MGPYKFKKLRDIELSANVADGQKQTLRRSNAMSAVHPKADIRQRCLDVRFVPLTDIGIARRGLGVHQIDRTEKIHLADVDAVMSEDGIGHRDVEKSVRDCHLEQVILTADDLAGCPG